MPNHDSITLCSENPETLVEFYQEVLQKTPEWSSEELHGFQVGSGLLLIKPNTLSTKIENTLTTIFDFEAINVPAVFERIKHIAGIKIIAEPRHIIDNPNLIIAAFCDPDGNCFKLTSPVN